MKILIVNLWDIFKLPPVMSLVKILEANGHNVTLITEGDKKKIINYFPNVKIKIIENNNNQNLVSKTYNFFNRKRYIRNLVNNEMKNNDILWTTTDLTVRELGDTVLKYKHVMQLMELIEDIPLFPYQTFFQSNLQKYAQKAYKVVVPEYNRAFIQKTWWSLEEVPTILPNKPYIQDSIKETEEIQEYLINMKNETKKIILYQGVFKEERPLEPFIQAVEKSSDYVLYLMGSENAYLNNLLQKYKTVKYIPFLSPPIHLLVTKYAHIGLLPYQPIKEKNQHYSILNSLYSAPNKIYEYSFYGIPMLGTKVPGIELTLEKYNIGKSTTLEYTDIVNKLKNIESNYNLMVDNCQKFYEDTNLSIIVEGILNENEN